MSLKSWPWARILIGLAVVGLCSDAELARLRRRIGFIFQDFCLIPQLTAEENITYPLIPRGLSANQRRDAARTKLARFGMEPKLRVCAGELSGGEQQRVAIARALAGDPEVLIADEPTSNLDKETASLLVSVLAETQAAGKSVVLSSHDPRLEVQANRIYELEAGKLKVR